MKLLLRKYTFFTLKRIALSALILLCFDTIKAQTNSPGENPGAMNLRWLVAGAFNASGENALFADYLGGEARVRPKVGATSGVGSNGNNQAVQWQEATANEKGELDFGKIWNNQRRAVAYAYTEITAEREKRVVATFGSGINLQVRLNGEVIHESRLSRKIESNKDTVVLHLRKGLNQLLLKTEGARDWKLQLMMHDPVGKIFVNQTATMVPDFRADSRNEGAWGQIEVANTSGAALEGVTVELMGDDLVFPSISEKVNFSTGEVKRIPFWVAVKRIAQGNPVKPLQIRVSAAGGEIKTVAFTPRVKKSTEYFVTTYRSFVDGSVQPFSVLLPTAFKPDEVYPLSLLLHGAHVTDWGQNIIAYDPKEWAIQVAVHDRGNNRYRDIGEVDIDEVLMEVRRRYRIDDDRIYLSGHSMGGYGTWFQATRRPDLWASISPQAGYSDYFLYNPAMSGSVTASQQFQKRLLEMWSPLLFAENLLHVPAYIVHGAKDDNVVVEHSRKMAARLKELGYQFVYDENPEGGHWWGPRGKYYGTEVVDKPPIWTFFQKHNRRKKAPSRVIFNTDNLQYRKAYWVTIDELDEDNQFARIEAEITPEKNAIRVNSKNITQFTLELDKTAVDANQPIAVSVDNRTVFRGALPPSKKLTLRREADGSYLQLLNETDLRIADNNAADRFGRIAVELDSAGNAVRAVSLSPEASLKKSEKIYGTIAHAFNRPFLFVVGTTGAKNAKDQTMVSATRRAAEILAQEWMARANGIVTIKADSDVTREDVERYNLILFGNAQINSVIAQINDQLPIKFVAGGVGGLTIGDKTFSTEGVGTAFVYPSPLNPERYVVIVGGTGAESMEIASRLRLHELPDYAVFDNRTLSGEKLQFVDGGFFDKFWRLKK